jgi:hypothetical protein
MKLSFGFYVTIVVLILVIFLTMGNSCMKYVPYSASSLYRNQTAYEGFQTNNASYSTYPDNVSIDSMNSKDIVTTSVANTCMKIFGFDGLQCSPTFNDNNLDIYSTAKGDTSCLYKGSGMSNSMGTLCLSGDMTKMLQTRGGNQTGSPALVGRSAV